MQVTASTAATPAVPAPTPAASAAADVSAPQATDTVTLSDAAQQVLASSSTTSASTSSSSTSSSSAASSNPGWSSDAVRKALAALNDTSGKTALADQIDAYKTLAGLVTNAQNFDPTKAANLKAVDVATAFSTSAFVQHYNALAAQFGAFNADQNSDHFGTDFSDMQQRQLNYFNSLSANDQQILTQTYDASMAALGNAPSFGSPEQYQATKQASIDVSRAVESLMASPPYADDLAAHQDEIANSGTDLASATIAVLRQKAEASGDTQTLALLKLARSGQNGDYTATVKAYFDQYGAAPAQSDAQKAADAAAPLPSSGYQPQNAGTVRDFFENIATLADSSGKASATDLVDAYKSVWSKASNSLTHYNGDVFWMAGWSAGMKATGAQRIQQADNAWNDAGWAGHGISHTSDAQSYYTAYEKLGSFDQQLVAALQGSPQNAADNTTTPDEFRSKLVDQIANGAESDAIDALYWAQNYGHLTAKSTVTILGVTLNLNSIMTSDDTRIDPYTRLSSDVKDLLKEAAKRWAAGEKVSIDATRLNGAPPTDAEKALATLKAYSERDPNAPPQTDAEKALAALKSGDTGSNNTAALTILKDAAPDEKTQDGDPTKTRDTARSDGKRLPENRPAAGGVVSVSA